MKKKLELNKLQVSSFVTELSKNNEYTVKAGSTPTTASVVEIAAVVGAAAAVVGATAAIANAGYNIAHGQSWEPLCGNNKSDKKCK